MFHFVARAAPGTLLFRTVEEAMALWHAITSAFPEVVALCLMPDHIHLMLPHADPAGRLTNAMSGYARWRNHRRRTRGATVWTPHPPPEELADAQHARRMIRYIHLNPPRKGLVGDPLEWWFSTHRDAVGCAARPVIDREREPARFHAYVSGDPSVDVAGTDLPSGMLGTPTWEQVADAVVSVCRASPEELSRRGVVRTLLVRVAWYYGLRDVERFRKELGLCRRAVFYVADTVPERGAVLADGAFAACVRAVGDPRFLGQPDMVRDPRWGRYRSMR